MRLRKRGHEHWIDMSAHSRSKNGVASLAYGRGHPRLGGTFTKQDVDGRDKPGHDEAVKSGPGFVGNA